MSTAELISAKASQLSEPHAQQVLSYIERLNSEVAPTARELRRLPVTERSRALELQVADAERVYRNNPDLILDVCDAPLDYGSSEPR